MVSLWVVSKPGKKWEIVGWHGSSNRKVRKNIVGQVKGWVEREWNDAA